MRILDQHRAPLFEALAEKRRMGQAGFHVPGHKFGQGWGAPGYEEYRSLLELDYTEIDGLDDLHHPEGVIREAQELAAACFGAEKSFLLVGGSTSGNLGLLTAVCARGDLILVQRNAHKSVIHGLMLAGARAVFLHPEVDGATGIAGCVSLPVLAEALERYPQAKGVFLTNPNYYGMGRKLQPYAELAHQAGMPLLVDEAHGAHFGFHGRVPASALSQGADAVVQSTHKMLTAMTMGAMLHVQGPRINRDRLGQRLAMLQSSSPSYPLMASLDLARSRVATAGERLLEEALGRLERVRAEAPAGPVQLVAGAGGGSAAYDYIDPFKLLLTDRSGRWTGFRLVEELAAWDVVAEMADDRHAVLAASLATSQQDTERLLGALRGLNSRPVAEAADGAVPQAAAEACAAEAVGEPIEMGLDLYDEADTEPVPMADAVGRISAQSVVPYPPGIPLLFPGERVSAAVADRILRLAGAGARFQGNKQDEAGYSILVKRKSNKSNGEFM